MIALAVLCMLYFLPALVAFSRSHNNGAAILMLNIFLGWTAVGWIVAIVWSLTDNTRGSDRRRRREHVMDSIIVQQPAALALPEQVLGETDADYIARLKQQAMGPRRRLIAP